MTLEEEEEENLCFTHPPYYCDGGCGEIVGDGYDDKCKRICSLCDNVDTNDDEENGNSDDDRLQNLKGDAYKRCRDCNYFWDKTDWDLGKGRIAYTSPAEGIKENEFVCQVCYGMHHLLEIDSTRNTKGNRLVVSASYAYPDIYFKIPDGIDLEDRDVVENWFVKYGTLTIFFVEGGEVEIEPVDDVFDFKRPITTRICNAAVCGVEYSEDEEEN